MFKYADDMAIAGLLTHTKPDDFYFQTINLILNTDKTKEMIIDFGRTFSVELPVFIDSKVVKRVCTFKHLVTWSGIRTVRKFLRIKNLGIMLFLSLSHSICPQQNAIILFNHLICQFYCINQSYCLIHVLMVRGQCLFRGQCVILDVPENI